ncbi:MAG: DUF1566 domain-containing protein [Bacteroidales bacterium]|nr:DUF1566 domain-containing protein [Bacteroidales bacterium]
MRKLSLIFIGLSIALGALAQSKVAVFDPEDKSNTGYKDVMREMLSTGISKSAYYKPVERALINKVLEENKYQSSGMVDDSKISELGKQMGADYVCVSMIQKMGTNYFITAKLVNVTTASVEFQEYVKTTNGENDLFEKIDELAGKLSSAKSATNATSKPVTNSEIPTVEINYQTYMVLPKDLNDEYTWQQAVDACNNLTAFGYDDWFLPDKIELSALYDNRVEIGGFEDRFYWSRTPSDIDNSTAFRKHFSAYYDNFYDKTYNSKVRCIRKSTK